MKNIQYNYKVKFILNLIKFFRIKNIDYIILGNPDNLFSKNDKDLDIFIKYKNFQFIKDYLLEFAKKKNFYFEGIDIINNYTNMKINKNLFGIFIYKIFINFSRLISFVLKKKI